MLEEDIRLVGQMLRTSQPKVNQRQFLILVASYINQTNSLSDLLDRQYDNSICLFLLKDILGQTSSFRKLLSSCTNRWPSLRATAVVGMGVDFTLIPRAMQAEEDLSKIINEFRSIEVAHSFV